MEPVIGYRTWLTTFDGERLWGMVFQVPWDEGINFARCRALRSDRHLVPEFDCTCGFYAFKTAEYCQQVMPWNLRDGLDAVIFGEVELTGKVIEHTFGYRGERARVKKLILSPSHKRREDVLMGVARYYKVPLIGYDSYFEMERRYRGLACDRLHVDELKQEGDTND